MKKLDKKTFKITYNVVLESIDNKTGKVIKRTVKHNLIVNDGLNLLRNWMAGDAPNAPSYIALGTDATAPANADTDLGTEVEREAATVTKPANYQVKYAKVFTVGSGVSYNIKEVGIFNAASTGTMLARIAADNTLSADTSLSVSITYTISR